MALAYAFDWWNELRCDLLCRRRGHLVAVGGSWTRNCSSPDTTLSDDFGRSAAKATKREFFNRLQA
ncbi:MAG TPA: hypothetical protein VGO57_10990 [Verrucomicrobiae bacterium]|jgi:hypothetical protein